MKKQTQPAQAGGVRIVGTVTTMIKGEAYTFNQPDHLLLHTTTALIAALAALNHPEVNQVLEDFHVELNANDGSRAFPSAIISPEQMVAGKTKKLQETMQEVSEELETTPPTEQE